MRFGDFLLSQFTRTGQRSGIGENRYAEQQTNQCDEYESNPPGSDPHFTLLRQAKTIEKVNI